MIFENMHIQFISLTINFQIALVMYIKNANTFNYPHVVGSSKENTSKH